MFRELMPLIENRPLSITVAALNGGRIRVNVVPQVLDKDSRVNDKVGYSNKDKIAKVPESAINALTTPLSLSGTPEEIDQSLAGALTQFVESHGRLQHTLDQARAQIAEAVTAAEERDKTKTKRKRSPNQMNSCLFGARPPARRPTGATNHDKAVQPEPCPLVQPVPHIEQPK
jgi:PRTRC genetic system protein E